jgi:hypothetical protein
MILIGSGDPAWNVVDMQNGETAEWSAQRSTVRPSERPLSGLICVFRWQHSHFVTGLFSHSRVDFSINSFNGLHQIPSFCHHWYGLFHSCPLRIPAA